jgi:predicted dehydrogenase
MRIVIVGCGFVADLYAGRLALHPNMELVGVTDRDSKCSQSFGEYHSVSVY